MSGLKKGPMAGAAAQHLDEKDWLPTILRVLQVNEAPHRLEPLVQAAK